MAMFRDGKRICREKLMAYPELTDTTGGPDKLSGQVEANIGEDRSETACRKKSPIPGPTNEILTKVADRAHSSA
jgi:hypothetical protein